MSIWGEKEFKELLLVRFNKGRRHGQNGERNPIGGIFRRRKGTFWSAAQLQEHGYKAHIDIVFPTISSSRKVNTVKIGEMELYLILLYHQCDILGVFSLWCLFAVLRNSVLWEYSWLFEPYLAILNLKNTQLRCVRTVISYSKSVWLSMQEPQSISLISRNFTWLGDLG